jgi:hypothetical protein
MDDRADRDDQGPGRQQARIRHTPLVRVTEMEQRRDTHRSEPPRPDGVGPGAAHRSSQSEDHAKAPQEQCDEHQPQPVPTQFRPRIPAQGEGPAPHVPAMTYEHPV